MAGPSFEQFVQARWGALVKFAYMLTGDMGLAQDLTQDVLADVHRTWGRVGDMQYPEAYVKRAVTRRYVSWRRRRSSSETPSDLPLDVEGEESSALERVELRSQLWPLLSALPSKQRAVLVLRFFEDMSDHAIAELLGCKTSTVRVHAARALASLRQRMPIIQWEDQA